METKTNNLKIVDEREVLGKDFRIYGTVENPLFLAKDVANWIEHSDVSTMLRKIDEEEKVTNNVCTPGGIQKSWFLTEDGLYEVLMQSRKPIAKKFKKEVKQILKTIRKHGAYMTDDTLEKALTSPDFLIQLATKLKEEKEARQLAENKNKLLNKENDALSQDILEWADESIINALVRKYGASIGKFGDSWIEFKKSLLYKYSINLNSRITNYLNNTNKKTKPKTLSMLKGKEELTKGLKTAISMCREKGIDISDILGRHLNNKDINKIVS